MTYFTINAILEESFLKKDGEVNNLSSDSKKTLLTFLFIINCLVFALLFNMNSNSKIRLESQKTNQKSMANNVISKDTDRLGTLHILLLKIDLTGRKSNTMRILVF